MTLDIWSILIIVIGCQGLFLLSVLILNNQNRRKREHLYLGLIIITLLWFLAEFFAIRNVINFDLGLFYGTRFGSWFLIGPLTYFYVRSITDSEWRFSVKNLVHFLPFFVFVILIPFIAYKAIDNRQVDYGMLSVFDHREKTLTTIQWTYSFIFIIQFVHLGFYLINNFRVVRLYSRRIANQYSEMDSKISWLKYFNVVLVIVLVLAAIFLYILLITDIYRRHLDYIYVLPIGLVFYFVSYKLMKANWKPVEKNGKYHGSSLDEDLIPDYISQLNNSITGEKLFLDPKLRLDDLANKIGISKHHLSQLLNQQLNISFFDFINKHRVEEAKKLIIDHPEYTLLQVAYDSGFNNKTSFVNAFKKFSNLTPSKFRDQSGY